MISINKVAILGRLGKDPEDREANGVSVARLTVATSRRYKSKDGERKEETEWHSVVLFAKLADVAIQYLQKGSEVYIEGRLRTRGYELDGVKRWKTEIVGETLQLGAKPKAEGNASGQAAPAQAQARPAGSYTAAEYARASGRAAPAEQFDDDIPF